VTERVLVQPTVPLLTNGGSFSKASAPPLFLEDENIFQKSAFVVSWGIGFLRNILIFEKKGGC
jgi:hypothetical protein